MGTATFIDILLAILLPPLGVFLRYGCGVITLFSFPLINSYVVLFSHLYIFSKIKVWNYIFLLLGWVLDMFGIDAAWVSSWDPLRPLCPHQMIIYLHLSSLHVSSSPCKFFFLATMLHTYMSMEKVIFWFSFFFVCISKILHWKNVYVRRWTYTKLNSKK